MINSILLTPVSWTKKVKENNVKDTNLTKAIANYEKIDDLKLDERIKAIAPLIQCATTLQKAKETLAVPALLKHLKEMVTAAEATRRDIAAAQAAAEKAAKAAVEAGKKTQAADKKADVEAKKQEQLDQKKSQAEDGGEEEDEEGDYVEKLKKAINNLKTSKLPYNFVVCDAKPLCAVMLSKQLIGPKHKEELTKATGGSKTFLKVGKCSREGATLIFEMPNPPQGLAGKLLKSIKSFTGIKYKVMVGKESAEDEEGPAAGAPKDGPIAVPEEKIKPKGPLGIGGSVGRGGKNKPEDVTAVQTALNTRNKAGLPVDGKCGPATIKAIEEFQKLLGQFKPDGLVEPGRGTTRALAATGKLPPPPAPPKPIAPPKLGKPVLATAPLVWKSTRGILKTNIEELKKGVRGQYGSEHPDLLVEIEEGMKKLGGVLENLDETLTEALERANAAAEKANRESELKAARAILAKYIGYVKNEPMINHMDDNPFGVKTSLKEIITDSLTHLAKAMK